MSCLDSDRLDFRHLAYRTLVSLVSSNQSVRDGHGLSKSYKMEPLVGNLPHMPVETGEDQPRCPYQRRRMGNSASSRNSPKWGMTAFAPLIATAVGHKDNFFSYLRPVLEVEGDLAEKMLLLVQGVLTMDHENPASRKIISKYLQQVLASSRTPTSSLRSVIAVILHLQAIQPPLVAVQTCLGRLA